MRSLVGCLIAVILTSSPLAVIGATSAAAAFTVVNNGATSWKIDGVDNPTLTLNQGSTYTFNVNASGHPFYIKTARVTGSGSQYTSGVTNNGVQIGTLTWTVPTDAPSQLFYQCGVHSSMGGTINILGPVDAQGAIPGVAWLGRAVPNPTQRGASFRLGLPHDARIDVTLFDARGRKVRSLWSGTMTAGEHSLAWDGRDEARRPAPSGTYFYRLRVESRVLTGRLVVTR
ncbi:MAG: T9SS type A sorting domain-containing protein [Candidatus Eisenbacteria bacterium]|uniref:T9SS type A sorting domain-containing protein n=1 Tax=Eiseniibacteriota bacterium TaxID=2212470 RepID=A0A538U7S8_UNCEI|nr:MAG: T9SS type A sorting domain-containing protein [Candidatus Eisenbacteria bacterium]